MILNGSSYFNLLRIILFRLRKSSKFIYCFVFNETIIFIQLPLASHLISFMSCWLNCFDSGWFYLSVFFFMQLSWKMFQFCQKWTVTCLTGQFFFLPLGSGPLRCKIIMIQSMTIAFRQHVRPEFNERMRSRIQPIGNVLPSGVSHIFLVNVNLIQCAKKVAYTDCFYLDWFSFIKPSGSSVWGVRRIILGREIFTYVIHSSDENRLVVIFLRMVNIFSALSFRRWRDILIECPFSFSLDRQNALQRFWSELGLGG